MGGFASAERFLSVVRPLSVHALQRLAPFYRPVLDYFITVEPWRESPERDCCSSSPSRGGEGRFVRYGLAAVGEGLADVEHLLGGEAGAEVDLLPVDLDLVAGAAADGRCSAPVRRVRLLRVGLDLIQRELSEDRIGSVIVRRRRGSLRRAGSEVQRHQVRPLRDGVHEGAARHRRVEHAGQEARLVDLVEAGDLRHHLPAGLGGPGEPIALALGARRGRLPGAVRVGGDLGEVVLEHLDRLRVLRPVGRPEFAVQGVQGEDRPVGVGQADALHELLDPRLVHPLGVGEEPHGQHGVGVDIVDNDGGLLVHHEAELQRRRHLLAGRQRDEAGAAGVMIERELAVGRVDLRALHGPVERDRVGVEGVEVANLAEHEVDDHVSIPPALIKLPGVPTVVETVNRSRSARSFSMP